MSKQAVKRTVKKKNGYQMPERIPEGEILESVGKKKWIIGQSIGVGGFGEIYCAAEYSGKKSTKYPYVVKIEPHGNGPLFVEMHFYMRNAKSDDIKEWKNKKKLKSLGMPEYVASGSHECNGTKYRFVVMERFGKDIWSIFMENNKKFPGGTSFRLGLQILDVLEYIHSKGYVHADIKGANILLGLGASNKDQVYLVDFGLAAHYTTKEFKPDPKKAHNGTIEYTSRDAHAGVLTRRGDLEILAYNLLHWLGVTLPWGKKLTNCVSVQNAKESFMSNLPKSLTECFGKNSPDALTKFFSYINKLSHDEEPDYNKCRSILKSGVELHGETINGPLKFTESKSPKRKSRNENETPTKRQKVTPNRSETPKKAKKLKVAEGSSDETVKKRGRPKTKQISDSEEELINVKKRSQPKSKQHSDSENESESTNGYTAEMLRIMKRLDEKKKPKSRSKRETPIRINIDSDENIIDGTPPSPPRRVGRSKRIAGFYDENSD